MKRYIVTEQQLKEYVEIKKSEKVFYDVLEGLYNNTKFLNENVSHKKANKSIIDNYQRKGLITSKVNELLHKYGIYESINDKKRIK